MAIKILPTRLSDSPDTRQRFQREAKAISSLNHPNFCTLYDIGCDNGVDFLVMECLEGEPLQDRLLRGLLPVEQVTLHGMKIADALDAARKGFVHRDLKPSNVFLTRLEDGRVFEVIKEKDVIHWAESKVPLIPQSETEFLSNGGAAVVFVKGKGGTVIHLVVAGDVTAKKLEQPASHSF